MVIERLGERAAIVRELPCPAYALAKAINGAVSDALTEAVASYETVGLYFNDPPDLVEIQRWIDNLLPDAIATNVGKRHEIPVCYELGIDLSDCASRLGIDSEELIALHLEREFLCFAVGFSPGFAYLGYLPESASLPRLGSPRSRVEAGSVGIAGRQTAVYPSATPGGWNLIGRCPLSLVNVDDDYFPITAGDSVQFKRIDDFEFGQLEGQRL